MLLLIKREEENSPHLLTTFKKWKKQTLHQLIISLQLKESGLDNEIQSLSKRYKDLKIIDSKPPVLTLDIMDSFAIECKEFWKQKHKSL